MIKKFLKRSNGISIMDVGIAITLFAIFAGLVGNLYYQIAFNNQRVRYDGIAAYNVVRLTEYIDANPIDSITSKNNTELKAMFTSMDGTENVKYTYPDALNMQMTVEKTLTNNVGQDEKVIIKAIKIEAYYEIMGKQFEYVVDKLKMAEDIYN